MWIVDSTVWIDYFHNTPTPQVELLDSALGQREIGVGDLLLTEVLQGIRTQQKFDQVQWELLQLPVFTVGGPVLALKSASNYRILRQRGFTIRSTIDCLVATFVIEHGFSLLHNDSDYDAFEQHLGLSVVHA